MNNIPVLLCALLLIVCCSCQKKDQDLSEKTNFTVEQYSIEKNGQQAEVFLLKNSQGMEVEILSYGAILSRIVVPDKDGNMENVLLTYESPEGFFTDTYFFGALAGRYANRIAKGKFDLDGVTYQLATNNGENHLHGGRVGFNKKFWKTELLELEDAIGVTMFYLSEDGEEGYPGNLETTITFMLKDDNSLSISMEAETDKSTIVNLTHHGYFNLSGMKENILNHHLQLFATHYTPVDQGLIPTGELIPVGDTPFDFRSPRKVGERIGETTGGYDHNFVIKQTHDGELAKMAILHHKPSGRKMTMYSDKPGVQFYSGNFLDGKQVTNGVTYTKNFGLCLEPQFFPDSPNQSHFPSPRLDPGEQYRHRIVYVFEVD
ncbi:aldose epimerase family protein [Cecembia lonarensis]|uniref:Aldose 1-epimerase n=1 Tax=Cecembia lonarensis (strain CCUG 58316 / KCTC 22772 / LW9) TaxID=1225176 RepID=K1LU74_CECL9|nr:aldose epimerase family protein [Cecembia lonarensis]EKB47664.1 Aldose 1-epimerase precursor [Cecembia lonarensis LW9]